MFLAVVWLETGESDIYPNQECPLRFTINQEGNSMTIMIGIDPHKATHTAVAVDGEENVLGEIKLGASNLQVQRPSRVG